MIQEIELHRATDQHLGKWKVMEFIHRKRCLDRHLKRMQENFIPQYIARYFLNEYSYWLGISGSYFVLLFLVGIPWCQTCKINKAKVLVANSTARALGIIRIKETRNSATLLRRDGVPHCYSEKERKLWYNIEFIASQTLSAGAPKWLNHHG